MNIKKFAQVAGLVSRRDPRMKVVQKGRKTLQIDFTGNEIEKRQLLATFSYSSNQLTIQTDSVNEQLSIVSNSEAGNTPSPRRARGHEISSRIFVKRLVISTTLSDS